MSAQEREALVDLLTGQTVSVQVPNVGMMTGFLRRESAEQLADLLPVPQPRGDVITFKLADPHDWSDDWCCVCGSEDVARRRGMYLRRDGSLGRVAWCSDPKCLEDQARTNYLPIPERLRAALASPVQPGRSEGEIKAEALREFADTRGVNVGDEDDDWWRGYRQAQRECLQDALKAAARVAGTTDTEGTDRP